MHRLLRWAVPAMLACPMYACAETHPGAAEFIQRAVSEYGLDAAKVTALLDGAHFQQSIVDAIVRPAEAKPWYQYRPIFLTPQRIDAGVDFWQKHRELIQGVAERYRVDPQFIVAIIGVETFYGRITGSYKVIDALATLSFHYPAQLTRDRSAFFAGELMQFLVLGNEEHLPLDQVTGSYAGAMGLGQFIPSSYREYAVDLDGDGSRDLWRSTEDAVGSVANYLSKHGWEYGGPVTRQAFAQPDADEKLLKSKDYRPRLTVLELHRKGYQSAPDLDPERKAALVGLEEKSGESYWLTFQNFFVITRYNRSPLYAMAVYQLGEELRQRVEASP